MRHVKYMKVALVYDRVNKWGGAERVLLALHKIFPDAPLYTSVYDKKSAPWADTFDIRTSFLQKFSFVRKKHEALAPLMPLAFEQFDFKNYDLVISLTSEAAKGIITKPSTMHVCYNLTPTRYLWSGHDEYFANKLLRTVSRPAVKYLRKWDRLAALRPDVFIAISKEVKKRIAKYYGQDAHVLHPPVDLKPSDESIFNTKKGNYYLIVSRMVPYKKLELAIKVCSRLNIPLKVVGKGSEEKRLRKMAGRSVSFHGSLTDQELVKYYTHSKGLLFPGHEDFGLTVVEAQMHGKPVLAYGKGGATETIIDGKTGLLFYPQTDEAFTKALLQFEKMTFDPKIARENAEKFQFKNFRKKLLTILQKYGVTNDL
jgi:glycosyltransferase involved in cell wall biosynthesis